MQRLYRYTELFGWTNLPIVFGLLTGRAMPPELTATVPYTSVVMIALLELLVSAGLIYASRQKQAGSPIGHKVYPATLVAYGLWLLMAVRWWGSV